MNYQRIKELMEQIKVLEEELEFERKQVLDKFLTMDDADLALCENKLEQDGVQVRYFPPTKSMSVDTVKLKKEGLFDKYIKVSEKKGYIKVTIKGDNE